MPHKNHYQTLHITPSATAAEIKKAFRKLALQYHPDKNSSGDRLAAAKFAEIQEAYRVLADTRKRAEYNYSLYRGMPDKSARQPAFSPEEVLQLSIQLARETATADPYRIDRDLLSFKIRDILSDQHLLLLAAANNELMNRKIAAQIMSAAQLLPFSMLTEIIRSLEQLTENDVTGKSSLRQFIREVKQQYYWNRYKVLFAMAITAIACLLILLSDKK